MFDFLTDIINKIFPGNTKFGAGMNRALNRDVSNLKGFAGNLTGASYQKNAEDALAALEGDFGKYSRQAKRLLRSSPKIDLSPYKQTLEGYEGDLLDSYLRSAGMVEGASAKGLAEAMKGYDSYLSGYKRLAQEGMPGEDIIAGRIGAGSTSAIQALKDVGGLTASGVGNAVAQQNESLRDLAIQSGMYRAQRNESLANAYAQYGQMAQNAYIGRANALQSAAGLRGAGISGAAGLAGQQAGLAQTEYQYNQLMPWQAGLNYNQQMAMATMPYQTQLQWNSEMMALKQAQFQSALQSGMYGIGQMWGNTQDAMGNLGMMAISSKMGANASSPTPTAPSPMPMMPQSPVNYPTSDPSQYYPYGQNPFYKPFILNGHD